MLRQLLERQQAQVAAIPPPPGVAQNFMDPPVTAQDAYILVGVGVAIAAVFVVLRIYTKVVLLKTFGLEDGAHSPSHSTLHLQKLTRTLSRNSACLCFLNRGLHLDSRYRRLLEQSYNEH